MENEYESPLSEEQIREECVRMSEEILSDRVMKWSGGVPQMRFWAEQLRIHGYMPAARQLRYQADYIEREE